MPRTSHPHQFTTEVWTTRGLVTYDALFVIELASRRVHLLGSTPYRDDAFMVQMARVATDIEDGCLRCIAVLLCDRDTKWSAAFRETLAAAGVRVVQTPYRAPNGNARAERFVRSIKEECLDRLIILGPVHLRRSLVAFMAPDHRERNHQGLGDRMITPNPGASPDGAIRCRSRLGGLLRYDSRAA